MAQLQAKANKTEDIWLPYIPPIKRGKLDKNADPEIFEGFSSTSKAYRIYLRQSNKVDVKDVKFLESESWN